jgi:hypothetical protein
MKPSGLCAGAFLILWSGFAAARSQFALPFIPYFPPEPIEKMVSDALDADYGKALLAQFAAAVPTVADPACLQSRKLDSEMLIRRGREIFQRRGTAALQTVAAMIDAERYKSALAAFNEGDVEAGLGQLAGGNADVKTYMEIWRPVRLARVNDFIFEGFDRWVMLSRGNFPAISPVGTGKPALAKQDPANGISKKSEDFEKSHDTAEMNRYIDLSAISHMAIQKSVDQQKARLSGPGEWFRGAEEDLGALCVPKSPSR